MGTSYPEIDLSRTLVEKTEVPVQRSRVFGKYKGLSLGFPVYFRECEEIV